MKDRRKVERKQTEQFFGVYHRETDEFVGRLIDMSTTGMLIHAVNQMDVDVVYEFKIDLPKPIGNKSVLEFDAVCLRCGASKRGSENYEIGFKITNIEFQELETIQYLLNDSLFHKQDPQPKVTVGIKPQ